MSAAANPAAAADDNNSAGIGGSGKSARLHLGALFADERLAVPLLRRPCLEWAERRRSQRFASAKIETGVVPGAADRPIDHEAVGEGAMIVAAVGADCEYFCAAARQEDLLLSNAPKHLAPVGQLGERYSQRQIRACRTRLFLGHLRLPRSLRVETFARFARRILQRARSDASEPET